MKYSLFVPNVGFISFVSLGQKLGTELSEQQVSLDVQYPDGHSDECDFNAKPNQRITQWCRKSIKIEWPTSNFDTFVSPCITRSLRKSDKKDKLSP